RGSPAIRGRADCPGRRPARNGHRGTGEPGELRAPSAAGGRGDPRRRPREPPPRGAHLTQLCRHSAPAEPGFIPRRSAGNPLEGFIAVPNGAETATRLESFLLAR